MSIPEASRSLPSTFVDWEPDLPPTDLIFDDKAISGRSSSTSAEVGKSDRPRWRSSLTTMKTIA